MPNKSILIVEDEVLIANQMKNWLKRNGDYKIDLSIDYNSAVLNLKSKHYDLVLLDVQLSETKTGIDVAKWITKNISTPFIFLTSYSDDETLANIKSLNSIGFINKPIREVNFLMMIQLFFEKQNEIIVKFKTKTKTYSFDLNRILYVQSDHVYLKIKFNDHSEKLIRCSLSNFMELTPKGKLLQVNRSVAVNPSFIKEKKSNSLILDVEEFTISPNYKSFFDSF